MMVEEGYACVLAVAETLKALGLGAAGETGSTGSFRAADGEIVSGPMICCVLLGKALKAWLLPQIAFCLTAAQQGLD